MFDSEGLVISPSIASADPLRLLEEAEKARASGVADLHVDVEDGNFIPNITFGVKTIRALRKAVELPFSFHLMTTAQLPWLEQAASFGPSIVFGHFEALPYPQQFIGLAKKLGVKCGLAFNPKTPAAPAFYCLEDLDGILFLSCEPDGCGEPFLPAVLNKIREVRAFSPSVSIWADGGILPNHFSALKEAGATHAVLGRAFFRPGL